MIVIDVEERLNLKVCQLCGRLQIGAHVWVSEVKKGDLVIYCWCRLCIKQYSHPKDFTLWKNLWKESRYKQRKDKAIKQTKELIARYPYRKFFVIIHKLLLLRHDVSLEVTANI